MSGERQGNGDGHGRAALDKALAARRRAALIGALRTRRRPGPQGPGAVGAPGAELQGAPLARLTAGPESAALSERCELCGAPIPEQHRHLLALVERRIVCSCEACWAMRSGEGDYRPTGNRTLWLPELDLPDELWASLQIPIALAFLMHSTVTGCVVAMYPSPAGATESELRFESWQELVERNPVLATLEPDIEGLIVNRLAAPPIYAIAPIDTCYALTGAVKAAWEGISGGSGVERAVSRFFEELRAAAADGRQAREPGP
jgi:hypothetical protein